MGYPMDAGHGEVSSRSDGVNKTTLKLKSPMAGWRKKVYPDQLPWVAHWARLDRQNLRMGERLELPIGESGGRWLWMGNWNVVR